MIQFLLLLWCVGAFIVAVEDEFPFGRIEWTLLKTICRFNPIYLILRIIFAIFAGIAWVLENLNDLTGLW